MQTRRLSLPDSQVGLLWLTDALRVLGTALSPTSLRMLRKDDFTNSFLVLGLNALPFVSLSAIFISMSMTAEVVTEMKKYNAQDAAGALIAVGLLRELAPLTVALAWVCRSTAYVHHEAILILAGSRTNAANNPGNDSIGNSSDNNIDNNENVQRTGPYGDPDDNPGLSKPNDESKNDIERNIGNEEGSSSASHDSLTVRGSIEEESRRMIAAHYCAALASGLTLCGYGLVIGFGVSALFARFIGVTSLYEYLEQARLAINVKDVMVYFFKVGIVNSAVVVMISWMCARQPDISLRSPAHAVALACLSVFALNFLVTALVYIR